MKTTGIRFAMLAAAAAAAGCAYSPSQIEMVGRSHTELRAVEVDAELAIGPVSATAPLSEREKQAVRTFAASYQVEGRGPVVISRPSSLSSEEKGAEAVTRLRALLLAEGIDDRDMVEDRYEVDNPGSAPVKLKYRTLEARAGDCPDLSSIDVTNVAVNAAMPSFGCALAANLAAMIADPSDLVGTHSMDPPDATRRTVVFTRYRAGEATGSARNAGSDGSVSNAVGN